MTVEKEEISRIGKCIISVDTNSNIHVDCKEPISKLVIDKSDVDMIKGVTDVVEKYIDIVKKK